MPPTRPIFRDPLSADRLVSTVTDDGSDSKAAHGLCSDRLEDEIFFVLREIVLTSFSASPDVSHQPHFQQFYLECSAWPRRLGWCCSMAPEFPTATSAHRTGSDSADKSSTEYRKTLPPAPNPATLSDDSKKKLEKRKIGPNEIPPMRRMMRQGRDSEIRSRRRAMGNIQPRPVVETDTTSQLRDHERFRRSVPK